MKVLVACEFSGRVRDAFAKRGHDAWSCDLVRTERPGQHIHDDVLDHLDEGWDLMIAHPPCTHLAISRNRYIVDVKKRERAIQFFIDLIRAPIPKIAVENPVGIISTCFREPNQIIQPYDFGEGEMKRTCLWLKNLPQLKPTMVSHYIEESIYRESPGPNRKKIRSRTFFGIARAMADQWGNQ